MIKTMVTAEELEEAKLAEMLLEAAKKETLISDEVQKVIDVEQLRIQNNLKELEVSAM